MCVMWILRSVRHVHRITSCQTMNAVSCHFIFQMFSKFIQLHNFHLELLHNIIRKLER